MSAPDEKSIRYLLRQAVPPVAAESEPQHDLWPTVRHKLNAASAAEVRSKWIWFDLALAAGLAVVTVAFPASIPLILYYL
jgi:hypothetical protein